MGPLVNACVLAALCASLCRAAPTLENHVVLVEARVTGRQGHTATLPCWLNPPQSAEDLEVRWYRPDHFDSPILFYRAKQFEDTSQDASYTGRVSFGSKDAASGGLMAGDVSLKLVNVTLRDAGDYTCYVSSDQVYDRAVVSLTVTETGSSPLLSIMWTDDNMLNVSCESEGWYPEPTLHWLENKQDLPPKKLKHIKEASGLLSVQSWVLISSSSEVSCSVGHSGEEAKVERVLVEKPPTESRFPLGWVAFALLLTAMLAVLGVWYYKKRGKKTKPGSASTEENLKLLPEGVIRPSTVIDNYENVTLDKVENKYVIIRDTKLRDKQCDFPDGRNVTCLTAVKGAQGFSSGKHYWEVSLGNKETGLKQSWWLGVTSAMDISQETTPTTSEGFWFLSSSSDRADCFQFSTEPKVLLPVYSRPQTVGVYLDYDKGELSFYNVEDESLIGGLTATFTGVVFPFFNPGKGDKSPMEVLQRTGQDQCSGVGNSVDSPVIQTEA